MFGQTAAGASGETSTLDPSVDENERALRQCLARLRRAPLDFRLRVEGGELLALMGQTERALRVLRSCADYFTLAGFPLRALWALKLLEKNGAPKMVLERGYGLLARQYARSEDRQWGDPIFEMPLPKLGTLDLDELPQDLSEVIAEVERRATDILRGTNFPDRLPRLPLLSDLPSEVFDTVARSIELRVYGDCDTLMEEGEPGSGVHLIVTGSCKVTKRREGIDAVLATLSEGDVFGEMALVDRTVRSLSATAKTHSRLLTIKRKDFYGIIKKDPELSTKLLWSFVQVLAQRLRKTTADLSGALKNADESGPHLFKKE